LEQEKLIEKGNKKRHLKIKKKRRKKKGEKMDQNDTEGKMKIA